MVLWETWVGPGKACEVVLHPQQLQDPGKSLPLAQTPNDHECGIAGTLGVSFEEPGNEEDARTVFALVLLAPALSALRELLSAP